jgi:hypothetical protein
LQTKLPKLWNVCSLNILMSVNCSHIQWVSLELLKNILKSYVVYFYNKISLSDTQHLMRVSCADYSNRYTCMHIHRYCQDFYLFIVNYEEVVNRTL